MIIALLCIGLAFAVLLVAIRTSKDERAAERIPTEEAFNDLAANADPVTKILIVAAKPLANLPQIYDSRNTSFGRWVERQLLAAGGAYGGSVELFTAVTFGGILSGLVVLGMTAYGLFTSLGIPFGNVFGILVAFVLASYPVVKVTDEAKKRTKELEARLPEFAELLQMPLSAGNGVLTSLDFTAQRSKGIVADEVVNLLTLIRTRSMAEAEAFLLTGERLGSPESKAFFGALLQAHLEGAKVAETIAAQAESLRKKHFETRRAELKKLPTKIILIFAVHMVPSLLIMALAPAAVAFTGMNF